MNRFGMRTITGIILFTTALIMLVPLLVAWSSDSRRLAGPVSDFIYEYPIPNPDGNPLNIVVESPGRSWFTMPEANSIGSLVVTSTTEYRFQTYTVPTASSTPYDLAFDGDVVWFTEQTANQIGSFDPDTETFSEYMVPTPDSLPAGISVADDGIVWFVEREGNQLGRFDPVAGTFTETLYTQADAALEDIDVAGTDNIWFSAPGVERIVRYLPNTGDFISVPVSTGPGQPFFEAVRVVIDSNGYPWVTAPSMDLIGRYTPGTISLWVWYPLPETGVEISGIDITYDSALNHIWFAESATGFAGVLTVNLFGQLVASRRFPLSTASSLPLGIAADMNGHVWITEYENSMIAEWRPPYFHSSLIPLLSR